MTVTKDIRTDRIFHALSDHTRRDILRRSLEGEHSISELAASYDMSFAAVQKHVSVLHKAGLLTKRRKGRKALTRGNPETIRSATALLKELEALWYGRVERMDFLIAQDNPETPNLPSET
ncbi:MAG: metalloregulator ArsR/SmtB family transcription factor [Bacteroidetes bacterium]|nr:metalloregulator ArsR/SmtB family transcription factor [Bacteroidota bacterium]